MGSTAIEEVCCSTGSCGGVDILADPLAAGAGKVCLATSAGPAKPAITVEVRVSEE